MCRHLGAVCYRVSAYLCCRHTISMAASSTAPSTLEQDRLEDDELALQAADARELLGECASVAKQAVRGLIEETPVVDLTDAQLDEAQLLAERELDSAAAAAAAAVLFDQVELGGSDGTVDVLVKRLGQRQKLGFIWSSDNTITAASEESILRDGDVVVRVNGVQLAAVDGLSAYLNDRRLQQPPRCRGHRGTWAAVLCVRRLPPQGRAADLPARHGRRAAWQQAGGGLAPRWHRRRRVERAVACSRVCVTEVCCVFVSVSCALGYTFICGQNARSNVLFTPSHTQTYP